MTTKTLPDSTTAAYYYSGSGVTLVNAGVQGKPGASGINFGFVVSGNNDTLINNGTIFGQRVGVYVTGSGDSVTNAAGKNITATEAEQAGVNFYNFSGTVTNYGTISGFASAVPGYGGNAVQMRHGGLVTNFGTLQNGGALFRLAPGTLVNSGVVLGNAAYGGVYMEAGGTVTNLAGGLISANGATSSYEGAPPYGVFIVGGAGTVTNAGTIDGGSGNAVLLAAGFQNRVIVDPGAVFVGTVNGGTAIDATLELASGASRGTLSGIGTQFVDFGTIAFDPSASWLVNTNTSIASALITGFAATDTIQISGHDTVSGQSTSSGVTHITLTGAAPMTLNFQGSLSGLQAAYSGGITSLGEIAGPTLSAGGTVTFTGGGSAVTLDPGLAITDASNITGATVAIGSGFVAGDQLNFNNTLGITGTFFSATGILELNGTASATDYQAALDSITFSFSSGNDDPTDAGNDASRTIDWTVVDATGSTTGSSGVITQESSVLNYGETIDETGIVAASETVSAGVMTLKNAGGTSLGTITVGSTLSTNFFTLASDGAGGTDVVVDTVFGTYASGVTLLTNPTTIASTGKVTNAVANGKAVSGPSGTTWTLTNFGQVTETASNGIGISFAQSGTITNASGGTITAAGNAITLAAGGLVTNASGGTINGALGVDAAGAAATVINAGRIGATGTRAAGVQVADGGQVTNQSGGTITGYSGVLGEAVTTVVNAGSIGANLTASGALGVVLFGSGAVTNLSGGIITGDYGVAITALGTLVNAGTITGNGTNATAAAGFYASGGGLVTNQSGGVITGFQGVWAKSTALTVQNAGSIGGNATVGNAAGAYLGAGGSVTNQSGGTITGYDGVKASGAAATVVNAGVIAGAYTSNYNNADGVYLAAGGSVTNQSGGAIYGRNDGVLITGAPGTVINLGTIHSRVDASYGGRGVSLDAGGLIINGASGGTASTAMIAGYNYAVQFGTTGTDTLFNYGTINGYPGTVAVAMDTGTLVNGASGATGALIESGLQSNAVMIAGVGTVVNYGSIEGVAANGEGHISYGISVGGSGSVTSVIRNLGSHALITGYVAVYASRNATITNAGTMEATQEFGGNAPIEAVVFGGGTNRLIVDPGAVFIGGVNGSGPVTVAPGGNTTVLGTANGVGTTTLELASGASAGTLTGVGVKYVGFAAVTVDSGAQWALAGYNTLASGVTLTNSGTDTVTGTLVNAGLVTGASKAVVLGTGGLISNQSGGTISATAANGIAVAASGAGTLVNAGRIQGNTASGFGISVASGGAITNQAGGTISGERAIFAQSSGLTVINAGSVAGGSGASHSGIHLNGSATVSNLSSGTITGNYGIIAYAAGATITNAGSISGTYAVLLNGAGKLTNQSGGTISGSSEGVLANAVATVVNAGGITGVGYGVQLAGGGTVIAQSGGTISSTGTAVSFGVGRTNRLVVYQGASFTGRVDGGNTIGASSISTLELASSASAGTFSGLGTQFIHFAQVTVDAGATWTLSGTQSGFATLTDAGTVTSGLTLGGGTLTVSVQATGTIAGAYGVRDPNGALTVVNAGSIGGGTTAGDFGVSLGAGGAVTNQAGGSITGYSGVLAAGAATVANAGFIDGSYGVSLGAGGLVTNQSGGTITGTEGVYVGGAAGTVLNAGYIDGTGTDGVRLADGGTITNEAGGTIKGAADAVSFASGHANRLVVDPGATFIGTVDGGNTIGAVQSSTLELASGASAGTLSGLGTQFVDFAQTTIDSGAQWTLTGTNTVAAGATLTSSGTLTDTGTLTNAGMISGGVLIAGDGIVTNAGTIASSEGTAGNAVVFGSGNATLIDDPGAVFTGSIVGGTSGTSTLELASGSSAGTITGLGSSVVNLTALDFDAGAQWTVAGNDSASGLGTLAITGFTVGDTIDLTGFDALGRAWSTGALVLTNEAGAHETLHIQGSFSTSSFLIASDGSGGTDITEATAPPTYAWVGGSADWNTPTNWSSGIIPGVGASATISDTGSNTVTIGAGESIAVADVTLAAGNTLQVSGTLLPAGTLGVTAATVAVVGTGAITGGTAGVTLYDGGNVITNQGTISGAQGIVVTGTAATGNTIIDSGTILGTAGTAISLGAGDDLLQFQPGNAYVTGTVSGGGGTNTLDFASGASAGTLTGANADFEDFGVGTVAAGASWALAGTDTLGSGITLTNSGTLFDAGTLTDAGTISGGFALSGTGSRLTVAASGYVSNGGTGTAISLNGAQTVVNYGAITVQSPGAEAPGYYGIALSYGSSVLNAGAITGNNNAALRVFGGYVTNTGLMASGRTGVFADAGVYLNNSGTVHGPANGVLARNGAATIINSGTIYGNNAIWVLNSVGIITNSGTLDGVIAPGVSLSDGGTITNQAGGLITAGGGNSAVYIGGAAYTASAAAVITNAGTITGGTGVQFFAGDTLAQTIVDSGTIIGTAGTAIAFSGGDDLLQFQPGNLLIQGTVDGGGGTNTLEFASGASAGTLTGSGAVFTNFADGTIDAGAAWVFSGTNTLGASSSLVDGGSLTVNGTFTNAGSILAAPPVTVAGTFINSGIISASGAGTAIYVANGGEVTNTASGTITGGTVAVTAAGIATIDNFGTIEATSIFAAIAIASGTVINGGASNTAAAILGSTYGVEATGVATVTNYGTITADHQEGVGLRAGGSLDNLGVIDANEYGVFLYGPGTATNSGTISGLGGMITNYAGDVVVNSGTITGTRGGGIILQAGGTVIDSGTIAASYFAVLFRGTAGNLLVLENGYKLSGPVGGSASASSNVVELLGTSAANAVTATYNSLGLIDIGTIAFAPGAANYATLVITNDGTLPHTIANFIGVHETIDLTALNDAGNDAVTSFNTLTDQLTVTAGTASVTLQLDSEDYSGVVFVAQQDGSGTAITPFTTAPPSIAGTAGGQAIDDAQTINPFSSAAIADANGTLSQSVTITLSDSADGVLSGTGLTETAPGVYSFTAANAAAASTLLDSLVFTPTAHQVVPGDTVSTTFTLAVTNGIGESASDSTTSVAVTALANAPSISGTPGGQGVPNQTTITPFASVTVTDLDQGAIDTATVSFDPADGTLSNLGSGSVSGSTYTITGTPGQVTAALDALTFTPATPASGYIDGPAAFGLTVTGTGGTASNDAASVTAATQVLGLATLSASQVAISVSPDGSGFGQPSDGLTNEAIVTAPIAGGSYTLPSGYQAEFLAGSVSATLSDASVGGAILVGNTGNDTLIAAAANDSIEAGNGNNVLVGGSGQVAIAAGDGDNTISLASDADYTVSAGNGSNTIFAAGSGSIAGGSGSNTFVALGGANVIRSQGRDFISAAAGNTTVQASGNGVRVLGGAAGSTLVATITGSGATVSAADSAATVFARGNDAVLFGGGQTAAFIAAGQADTIAGGAGATRVTVTGNDGVLLGGAGSLNAVIQGTGATIGGGAGAATVSVQTSALMFGNAGPLLFQGGSGISTIVGGTGAATVSGTAVLFGNAGSTIDYTGASGGAQFVAGSGSETFDASGASTGNEMWGSANAATHDVLRGGSGSDTLVAGAGAATLSGGAGANTFVFFHADAGGSSVITDFSAADDVVLSGYAASEAGMALQTATSSAGATALTLSDGTRITFLGIASASTLQGHLI